MLLNYVEAFRSLNPNTTKDEGDKPYKPALLLAVIEGVEEEAISKNQIFITPELIASFRKYHKLLNAVAPYQLRHFVYPFVYLQGERFWQLRDEHGQIVVLTSADAITSMKQLQKSMAYARLDLNLWNLLQTENTRTILRNALIAKYA